MEDETNRIVVIDGEPDVITERDRKLLVSERTLVMDFLIMILNRLLLIHPIEYEDFNKVMVMSKGLQEQSLLELEEQFPAVGITSFKGRAAFTTLSLIATITDVLVGDRLSFLIEKSPGEPGKMVGCEWYYKDSVNRQRFLNWIVPARGDVEETG